MAADHLVGDGACHVGKGEAAGLLCHASVIDHLEQQVAEFVRQGGEVAPGDGVGDFVGLLDRVGRDRVEILLTVPRTAAVRGAQGGHDVEQAAEFGLGLGRSGAGGRAGGGRRV